MSELTLSLAQPADAADVATLVIGFRDFLQRSAPTDEEIRLSVIALLRSPDAQILLARRDGVPVGYVTQRYRYFLWANGLGCTIEDLFVASTARRGGVGRRLIEKAIEVATARGCRSIGLDTNENNVASNLIYTSLGFNAISQVWKGRQIAYRKYLPPPA
ncbi:MAG: GNAT family N-acetyltransferase [Thermoflexales bacterium]|nr:GNAT family N-acetyltransferase [Thermoflexales bacterium]